MATQDFDGFLAGLSSLVEPTPLVDLPQHAEIRTAAEHLLYLRPVDRSALSATIAEHPEWVPTLALVVGVSQERLKNYLKHRFGSSGWAMLARTKAAALIQELDKDYGLVAQLKADCARQFTLADVLIARAGGRQSAGQSVKRGRRLEDEVEKIAQSLSLPYQLRTQFTGSGKEDLPCDLAIPAGGASAKIVCAVKGFDSTGSKLSDAVKEIRQLADYRRPTQFIFAIVDGIGWLSRKSDLRAIFALWEERRIDGLYSLTSLPEFAAALSEAADRSRVPRRNLSTLDGSKRPTTS